MQLSPPLLVGLGLGAAIGFIVGFLIGIISRTEEKEKAPAQRRPGKAERLFQQALAENNLDKKHNLLKKVVDKYPKSEWADKALEEVMKTRKGE